VPEFKFTSLAAAFRKILKDHDARENRLDDARRRAADKGAQYVRRHMPVAFGELRDSVHTGPFHTIVADAPHAAAVERGSRPHTPPLAPLIDWVKLRGMQGLDARGRVNPHRKLTGSTTRYHAARVAGELHAMAQVGAQQVEDAAAIARGIQRAIAAHGTKPHWFMRASIPKVREILAEEVQRALHHGRQ
jgi:hypothetical protein